MAKAGSQPPRRGERSRVHAALDRRFKREDLGDPAGGLYMERWVIAKLWGCALYLHRYERSDWSRDLHDHPRSFWTIPLVGGYWNETEMRGEVRSAGWREKRLVRWPFPRFRRARHSHRVQLDRRWPHPWTLVLMLRKQREWGFWSDDGWVRWDEYLARPWEAEA